MTELQRGNAVMRLLEAERPDLPGRFIRAVFVGSKLRTGKEVKYLSEKYWEDDKVHLLLEMDLRLVDDSPVQKLKLCKIQDLERVPKQMITCSVLKLADDEKVVGFKWHEVQSQESASTIYYNVQVMLQKGQDIWSEPLSRELFHLQYPYPGHEVTLQSKGKCPAEVQAFRAFSGQERHHITGLVYQSGSNAECMTGKDLFFWVDVFGLTGALYYLDVGTDIQQLVLFYSEERYEYFAVSCIGISIPIISTVFDAVKWSENPLPRPQADLLKRLVPSVAMRCALIVTMVLMQLHMMLLVFVSAWMRTKHDLLLGAKLAEVAEAVVSAGLQMNFWFLILVNVEFIAPAAFQSLTISVLVSCGTLAFGFASRDKVDARVLNVPGKLVWGPLFAALTFVRFFEVTSRLCSFNMLHVATRTVVPIGGPVAVAASLACAWYFFPEAEKSQIFAAVIGHPGQVMLGSRSRIPLGYSLFIHLSLQVAALGLQGLININDTLLPEAKAVPWPVMVTSVGASVGSTVGLMVLSHFGDRIVHPIFEQAANGDILTCTTLAAVVDLPQVSVPVLAAATEISLDMESLKDSEILTKLAAAKTPVKVPASCMEGIESKLQEHPQYQEQLASMNVIEAHFNECNVDSASSDEDADPSPWNWKGLRSPWNWFSLRLANLKHVHFYQQKVCAAALQMLAGCDQLEEIAFKACNDTDSWGHLREAKWPKLRKAEFQLCITEDEAAAEVVLQVLSKSPDLEVLGWRHNVVPHMEKVDGGSLWNWHRLRIVEFSKQVPAAAVKMLAQCQHLEEVLLVGCADFSAWNHLKDAAWPRLRVARFPNCFEGEDAKAVSAVLLQTLAKSTQLEELNFYGSDWPETKEWDEVFGQNCWPKLQWEKCHFGRYGPSDRYAPQEGEGATTDGVPKPQKADMWPKHLTHVALRGFKGNLGLLLSFLAESPDVEVLDATECRDLQAGAWQFLEKARWPVLRVANFTFSFFHRNKGLEGAPAVLKLLARCHRLEVIDFSCCDGIAAEAWELLREAHWPQLKEARWLYCRIALQAVLQTLGRCPKLELLNFDHCGVRETHLQELPDGCWPCLKKTFGFDGLEDQLKRLKGTYPSEALGSTAIVMEETLLQSNDSHHTVERLQSDHEDCVAKEDTEQIHQKVGSSATQTEPREDVAPKKPKARAKRKAKKLVPRKPADDVIQTGAARSAMAKTEEEEDRAMN